MYILKAGRPAMEIVEGPLAGMRFVPGQEYPAIPAVIKTNFRKLAAAKIKKEAIRQFGAAVSPGAAPENAKVQGEK